MVARTLLWGTVVVWIGIVSAVPTVQLLTESGAPTDTITLGQRGILEVTVDQRGDTVPTVPSVAGVSIQYGGIQQSMSIRNGVTRSSIRYRYIVEPEVAGIYTIGPITVQEGGKNIEVVGPVLKAVEVTKSVGQIIIDKTVWTGSECEMAIECAVSPEVDPESIRLRIAPLEGCQLGSWTGPIKDHQKQVVRWTTRIVPQTAGAITVGPVIIEGIEEQNNHFFFPTGRVWRTRIPSVQVSVQEMPAGITTPYRGLFTQLTAKIDRTTVQEDESVLLTLELRGSGVHGGLPALSAPTVSGVDIYPSTVRRDAGCMQCEYIVRSSVPGDYCIGPYCLEFFNTQTGQQEMLTAESCVLKVVGTAHPEATNAIKNFEKIPEEKQEKDSERDLDATVRHMTGLLLCAIIVGGCALLWGIFTYIVNRDWWVKLRARRRACTAVYTCCVRGDIGGLVDAFNQVGQVYSLPDSPEWREFYTQLLAIKYGGGSLSRDMHAYIVHDAQRWLNLMTRRNSQKTVVR